MAIIGNPIVSTDFPKDTFSGNGSTTAFTMSIAPASVNAVIVVVSGITQDPSTYTISGTTLTFSGAPPTGTSNISVRHLGIAGIPNTPSVGSVVPASLSTGAPSWNSTGTLTVTNSAGSTIVANRTANPGSVEIQYGGTQTAQLSAVSGGGLEFYQGSSPTLAMKYDSAGRVTTPSQTMFAASASGAPSSTTSSGNYIPYLNVISNVGSAYNSSTYKFTAPVSGIYMFQMNLYSNGSTNGSVRFCKNDVNSSSSGPLVQLANGNTSYPSYGVGVIESLSAGDTFGIKCTFGSVYNDADTWFSGYLLG